MADSKSPVAATRSSDQDVASVVSNSGLSVQEKAVMMLTPSLASRALGSTPSFTGMCPHCRKIITVEDITAVLAASAKASPVVKSVRMGVEATPGGTKRSIRNPPLEELDEEEAEGEDDDEEAQDEEAGEGGEDERGAGYDAMMKRAHASGKDTGEEDGAGQHRQRECMRRQCKLIPLFRPYCDDNEHGDHDGRLVGASHVH